MSKNVEVESGELAIFSDNGTMAIVPAKNAAWVKKKLAEGCNECVDRLVATLPHIGKEAEKGGSY